MCVYSFVQICIHKYFIVPETVNDGSLQTDNHGWRLHWKCDLFSISFLVPACLPLVFLFDDIWYILSSYKLLEMSPKLFLWFCAFLWNTVNSIRHIQMLMDPTAVSNSQAFSSRSVPLKQPSLKVFLLSSVDPPQNSCHEDINLFLLPQNIYAPSHQY